MRLSWSPGIKINNIIFKKKILVKNTIVNYFINKDIDKFKEINII